MAIGLPHWGELRNAVAPDLYAEAFSAGVDYLRTQALVDPERIGVLGIGGSGSFAISAAKLAARMKAITPVSMYDMGAASRDGLRNGVSLEQRNSIIAEAARRREVEFSGGETAYTGGTLHELTPALNLIEREFYDFYRTPRGEFIPAGSSPHTTPHPTLCRASSSTPARDLSPTHLPATSPTSLRGAISSSIIAVTTTIPA